MRISDWSSDVCSSDLPRAFQACEVPIIAAVNGFAIGVGCDLACFSDVRIAGESASFASSFIKLGLVPGDGGPWALPRAVGFARAAERMLTRSEERRVGKECVRTCRSGWTRYHEKKKQEKKRVRD